MKKITLVENVKGLVLKYGANRCCFVTLTFPELVVCPKEASRRFNSYRQLLTRVGMKEYICVQERHSSGGIHYHLIVAFDFDVKGRLSDRQILAKRWASAPKSLRELWQILREQSGKYGFGRTQAVPVAGDGVSAGLYLGKYLSKGVRHELDKGVRLVRFGLKTRFASSQLTYIDSYFRRACCILFGDIDVRQKIGSRWAYLLQPAIQFAIDALKGLHSLTPAHIGSIRSYVYYGSSLFSFSGFRKRLISLLYGDAYYA